MGVAGDARLNGKTAGDARKKGREDGIAAWRGFVNRDLTAAEKEQFDDWAHTQEPWDTLEALVSCGAHVAIKINPNGGGYLTSITQRNPAHPSAGLCVTARSGETGKSLLRALYIVYLLGVEGDWGAAGGVADPDRW